MKIRQKLTLLLLFIGLIPTVVVSFIAYITISTQLINSTENQLESIVVKQEQRINSLLQGKQEELLKLANRYDLQLALSEYLSGKNKNTDNITTILRTKKVEVTGLQAIYVTNPNDMVIATTLNSEEEKSLIVKADLVKSGQTNSITVKEDKSDGINKLYIATSINVNKKDVVILTQVFRVDDIIAALQDYTGLGKSGETLIAAKDVKGNVVSLFPLRFDPDGSFKTNLNSMLLFEHLDSTYTDIIDYENHSVIASTRHIAFADWIIATMIDSDEALAPIAQLRNTLILIFVVVSMIIVTGSVFLTRQLTAPIVLLTQKTREIMQGDFTQRASVTSSDEIGTLATTFNEMTTKLQDLYQGLEQKVQDKTAELAQKMEETERVNKMMVGRELKMIELKEELKKLQDKETPKES